MADRSAIEWTDATWNPIRARHKRTGKVGWHCEHATTGCIFCYAERRNKWIGTGLDFKPGHRQHIDLFLDEQMLTQPLRWKTPRRIFVGSMTDLFADFVPDAWLDKIFAVMALAPQHTFQVLTKRPARMRRYLTNADQNEAARAGIRSPGFTVNQRIQALLADYVKLGKFQVNGFGPVYKEDWERAKPYLRPLPLPNVWLGTSAERQPEADERIPELLATPSAIRFVSIEPLLDWIDLGEHVHAFACHDCFNGRTRTSGHFFDEQCPACAGSGIEKPRLDWVIVGLESGPKARIIHPDCVRSLRDQCAAAGVAFFFKQWGEHVPIPLRDNHQIKRSKFYLNDRGFPFHQVEDYALVRVGKKAAGRKLDGVEHNEFPRVSA
ncbi:phage Gp37/Gp68 family protein [Bradyrhizobium manausense]|uniref:DUF5131 family protein n=1 Tax=Bradyrhizobium manausense TaxID=989370 RepID=UPI001BA59549|nr:phage Gp37/Gp68 family protein [Bradyrhizobium manausense]